MLSQTLSRPSAGCPSRNRRSPWSSAQHVPWSKARRLGHARIEVSTASRSARAADLKQLSAIWWLLSPSSVVSTCSVSPPFIAKAVKNSRTSSVSNVPIFVGRETRHSRQGTGGVSRYRARVRVSASSIGKQAGAVAANACRRRRTRRGSAPCPSAMPTSSTVWWSSICRSPVARTVQIDQRMLRLSCSPAYGRRSRRRSGSS